MFIAGYKNLEDVWLPWEARTMLIGPNGVGKTNLLEACALLMGSPTTRGLVSRRLSDDLNVDISVIVRESRSVLNPRGIRFPQSPLTADQAAMMKELTESLVYEEWLDYYWLIQAVTRFGSSSSVEGYGPRHR